MPLWAVTTLWFLRSYKTHSALYAVLAGIGAAGCMLGKYWSVFLLAGLAVAALINQRRSAYFRTAAPWLSVVAGVAMLAPHLLWLYRNDFAPFEYAVYVHGAKAFSDTVIAVLGYLAGSVGYVAVPVIVVLAITRPSRVTISDMAWPVDTERTLAAAAFWAPLLLPAVGALASGIELTSLWSMSAWTLLPVLLLSPPAVTVKEIDTRRILAGAVVLPLVMLIASPVIAIIAQRNGPPPATAQAGLLADEVERLWRETTPLPLRFVGGDAGLTNGVISYATDRPHALPKMPPPDAVELSASGQVVVCFAEDVKCRAAGAALPGGRTIENEIVRNFLRFPSKPQRYTIFIVPPRL